MSTLENRNLITWGNENQKKLHSQRVMVLGTDTLSQYVIAGLTGLSIGSLYLMDNSTISRDDKNFLCSNSEVGRDKVVAIKERLHKINKDMNIEAIYSKFCEAFAYRHRPTTIIDASNEPSTKLKALRYSLNYGIPVISVASDAGRSVMGKYVPKGKFKNLEQPSIDDIILEDFEGKRQGSFSSGIGAAHTCEELRKLTFQYEHISGDKPLPNNYKLNYNVHSKDRMDQEKSGHNPILLKSKKALVVGAGGIGNYVALNLGLMGWGQIDIVDFDSTEEHNLNRQILLYDRIDEYKSITLAERINELRPANPAKGIKGKFGEVDDKKWLQGLYQNEKKRWQRAKPEQKFLTQKEFINKYYGINTEEKNQGIILLNENHIKGYDVIFGCLDSKFARLWLNKYAVKNNITYIDGGAVPTSGQVATYIPGKTNCIDCQLSLEKMPPPHDIVSCGVNPQGGVVMSNMLVGGLMVGEAVNALYNNNYRKGPIRYDALSKKRLRLTKEKRSDHGC